MPEARPKFGVHSEYGKLHEVVVGRVEDLALPPWSADLRHYNAELTAALKGRTQPLSIEQAMPERYARAHAQMENLAATYQRFGVIVHRPRLYTEAEKRYLVELQAGHSQLYPADPVYVLGDHFLELNIRRAYRRKEVFPLHDVVVERIADEPGSHHVAIPPARPHQPAGEGPGPFLEGGDIFICGRDVIVGQHDLCSDAAGIRWLARYLAPHGYRVHPMPLQGGLLHGLGVLCLIREGLLLAYLPALVEGLPAPVKDWEVIELSADEARSFATVGVSIDEKTLLIEASNKRVMDELDKRGVEPVPLPAADLGFFGGSLRCSTLPLSRDA
jgi:N-dimethylarginine dimethylaminohydrolase